MMKNIFGISPSVRFAVIASAVLSVFLLSTHRACTGEQKNSGRISGYVRDEVSRPIDRALVKARYAGSFPKKEYSDKRGFFEFKDLRQKPYRLKVTHSGFAELVKEDITPSNHPLALVMIKGCTLEGTVTSRDTREVVKKFNVRLRSKGTEGGRDIAFHCRSTTGSFSFDDLTAGEYAVAIEADGYALEDMGTIRLAKGINPRPLRVSLFKKGYTITGKIISAKTGKRVSADVYVIDLSQPPENQKWKDRTWATPDNGFEIMGLKEGDWEILVTARTGLGYRPYHPYRIERLPVGGEAGNPDLTIRMEPETEKQ